ncbi:MAG: globin [Ketobacter sp.]|nr:globin [Ketobacter sp.]
MNHSELINLSLEQAVAALGDPTDPVFELMYTRHPELKEFLREDNSWQNYMIQEILQNLMAMSEDPSVALAIIRDMTQHHQMIGITAETFKGLYQALLDTIVPVLSGPLRDEMVTLWQDTISRINHSVDSAF